MIQRIIRDESGMTMALAIMMIVLIGVMGAGLLAFVQSDLSSVIEVNKGQKALDIAEAGVQAAKSHLRVDSFRQHYDTVTTVANDCAEGPRVGGDNWSKTTTVWTATTGACSGGPIVRSDVSGTPWREDVGVSKLFGGGRFHVTIECFDQLGDPTGLADPCVNGAGPAPVSSPASEIKFFKITSTGYDSVTGDGAIRKIEAIYSTEKNTYAPVAFWTPGNIDFNGNTTVSKMSFFAGGNITGINNVTPITTNSDGTTREAIYGNWKTTYNPTKRIKSGGGDYVTPGFGALGLVCGATQCTSDGNSVADGWRDYDSTTGLITKPTGQHKTFVKKVIDPNNEISFPFDPRNAVGPGSNPREVIDPGLVEEMRSAAQQQGFCYAAVPTPACSRPYNDPMGIWPAQGAIVFVDGSNVTFKVNTGNNNPKAKGILIVRDGNFNISNASNGFEGVIIVIGNPPTTGKYTTTGQVDLDGYVAASGDIKIAGNIAPSTTIDFSNLNSFYDVKLWSWRELYQQ